MDVVQNLKIMNKLGLHARAAAKIVELANSHRSKLYLKKDGHEVDGDSILSILTLACPRGSEVQARIVGEDSEQFMLALQDLFERRFGEHQ
ncbi:Phosphocarrier protein HPr [uncultured Desulfatiglans sp.]|uniref:Phosphocarrier protein HPr n=1 Tax=Uncultured Desulfatiglans sp. TaxID=1748965 RepID=A0A653A1F0_UNCDX|nr:Phosphocarrier protein HPr [uncultured Desulfatiglans sp.]